MKNSFAILLMTLLACACLAWTAGDREPRHKMQITGTVYEWRPYKGQYADSLRSAQGFHPVRLKLYVRRINHGYCGVMPICDSIISDSLGRFKVELEEGDYCLIEPWKLQPLVLPQDTGNILYDTACIANMYRDCDYNLHIRGEEDKDICLFRQNTQQLRCRIK